MSQAKVDARKEQKKNRKKIEAHAKRMALLRGLIALVVVALIGAWAGYSGYVRHEENKPHQTAEVDYTSVNDYLTDMSSHEDEDTDAAESEDAGAADDAGNEDAGAAEGEDAADSGN